MTFREKLINSRSHIAFILGLIAAFALVIWLETLTIEEDLKKKLKAEMMPEIRETIRNQVKDRLSSETFDEQESRLVKTAPRPLWDQEKEWARIAWSYFESNYRESTGMVDSVKDYPATTMWDAASYLMALISALRLNIISENIFHTRLGKFFDAFEKLELFDGKLPNKFYHTLTLEMVTAKNMPTDRGIGWSAIDMGRLLTPFNILVWNYPRYTGSVREVINRWDFDAMVKDGVLMGTRVDNKGKTVFHQEGRLGYEQYAAKSLALMGMDVFRAMKYDDFLKFVDVYGIRIPVDSRDPKIFKAHNYVVSESYILDGIEFGWDDTSENFARRVFLAQKNRYKNTGMPTAVSEDNIDQPPYFVYNTVFTDGKVWNAITEEGKDASEFKTISTKAVFGWYALYQSNYTRILIDIVKNAYESGNGWYSGIYEKDMTTNKVLTANTNGIILESLAFIRDGGLVAISRRQLNEN